MAHYNNGNVNTKTNKQNNNEMSSFEKAVMNNLKQSIQKHLSPIKIQQNQLNYALFLSIENFKVDQHAEECLLILLRHKANPNCQLDSETPLTLACKKGQQLLVKTLLQNGAKADLCNKKGQHPLGIILADKRQNYDVAQVLVSYMSSINIQIGGHYPIVLSIDRQFFRIFQILIEKGAALIFENETVLHIITKKKFNKIEKKKKFIKQLSGRLYLIQQDINHKTPIDYQENEEIRTLILQNFKPKIIKQQTINKLIKQKQLKQRSKDSENNAKDSKKKMPKDLQNSFSEIDEEQWQDEKADQMNQNRLKEVIEIPQEEDRKQNLRSSAEIQIISNKSGVSGKKSIQINNIKQLQSPNIINKKQKTIQQPFVFVQCKEEQKQKVKKKLNTLAGIQKRQVNNLNQSGNAGKKKNKTKNQDIISKTLLKRKNSSMEQQSAKLEKNKTSTIKKGNTVKKQATDTVQKQQKQKSNSLEQTEEKVIFEQKQSFYQDQDQNDISRRIQILKQFEELGLHIQQQDKVQKQSQTDSQESFQGNFVNLNQQIYQFVNQITMKNQQKIPTIQSLLKYLQDAIRKELQKDKKNVRVQLYIYGSQSTGLCIQQSDLDVLIATDYECGNLMKLLQQRGTLEIEGIIETKFITGATMPVIKIKTNYKYDGMCVDLTFQTRNHMGIKCAQTIKAFMQAEPLLRPLALIIKFLVNTYGLSDPYKGGLGSYAITLMVIALLQFTQKQKKQIENVGQLLLKFLYFYGKEIDYVSQAIIIHELGLFGEQPVYCIYRLPYFTDLNPKLIIYDPLNPVNNVGRTTYRIAALKKLFSVCYLRFKQDSRCQLKDILDGSFSEIINEF